VVRGDNKTFVLLVIDKRVSLYHLKERLSKED
jgi:hypothetical protein